jgi:hypothetical protein
MKINILVRRVQPNGHRVADEMDLVTAGSELDSEFGGHHTRPAVRWVTCDPDFHGPSMIDAAFEPGNRLTSQMSAIKLN